MQPQVQQPNLWNQPFYRVRKKVMALAGKYWIEDHAGNQLGFSKQKLMKLKEDIRIYSDDSMQHELFQIRQQQIIDAWGIFSVIDSPTGQVVGQLKRQALKSGFVADEYHLCDANGQPYGRVYEEKGKGLMRKFLPGGDLIPEKVWLEVGGQRLAEISQQFKIIGDIWEVNCQAVPPQFDRRVLLAAMLTMAMIERKRK
jgi:uncharacterized protein YxjI